MMKKIKFFKFLWLIPFCFIVLGCCATKQSLCPNGSGCCEEEKCTNPVDEADAWIKKNLW